MSEQLTIPNLSSMTWEQFYESCKPEGLILQYMNVKTITDSVSVKRVSLKDITFAYNGQIKHKVHGECFFGILYFYEWLNYLNRISNINKPLPPDGMQLLSKFLYMKYYYFYLSDLKLVIEWLLEGVYGTFYNSVDSQRIMTGFARYAEKRQTAVYELKNKGIIQ